MPIIQRPSYSDRYTHQVVAAGTPLDEIPDDLRARIDRAELDFFLAMPHSLDDLIGRCDYEPLRDWLALLRHRGFLGLEVLTGPGGDTRTVLRFRPRVSYSAGPAFHLPRVDPVGVAHPALVPVYSVIGGVLNGDPDEPNDDLVGLSPEPFSTMGWVAEDPPIDPDQCFMLLMEPDGNVVGWHPSGQAVYCDHGKLSWYCPLEDWVEGYFRVLIEDESRPLDEDELGCLEDEEDQADPDEDGGE